MTHSITYKDLNIDISVIHNVGLPDVVKFIIDEEGNTGNRIEYSFFSPISNNTTKKIRIPYSKTEINQNGVRKETIRQEDIINTYYYDLIAMEVIKCERFYQEFCAVINTGLQFITGDNNCVAFCPIPLEENGNNFLPLQPVIFSAQVTDDSVSAIITNLDDQQIGEYSIGDNIWQTNNTFNNLDNGTYTLYIRYQGINYPYTKEFTINVIE
jgi:hypothetical protein